MLDLNEAINNLKKSIELIKQEKIDEAENILLNLSNFKEIKADTFLYLGICNVKKNKKIVAIDYLKKSLRFKPEHEYSNLNLGLIYFENKQYELSLNFIKKTLRLNENNKLANYHVGLIYIILEEYKEAEKYFKKLIFLNSEDQNALLNLGIVYNKLNMHQDSIEIFNKLIKLNPKNIYAYNNLGTTYNENSNYEKAIDCFNQCNKINPNYLPAYSNLGITYSELKEFDKALKYFNRTVENNKNDYNSLFAIGKINLSVGNYNEGFNYYEYRKYINSPDTLKFINQNFKSKEWRGENIEKKKILIISEQGFGDTIQFSRYLLPLIENNKVTFVINKKLNFIFRNLGISLINNIKLAPEHDYYQFLLTLPKLYYEKNKGFLKNHNFITSDENIDDKWSKRINNSKKIKVGIFWQGNKNYYGDNKRSIPLFEFEKIINNDKCKVISLQKGFGEEQIIKNAFENNIFNLSSEIDNDKDAYKDSISILKNLDLLITCDSSLVHLAGTMNINTWVVLCYNHDWRWYVDKKNPTFYKSVKIFDQKFPGDWKSVFQKINFELENKIRQLNI